MTISAVTSAKTPGLVGHIGHERPEPPLRHDVAVLLQALVHLAHGVVVHLHLGGQAPAPWAAGRPAGRTPR